MTNLNSSMNPPMYQAAPLEEVAANGKTITMTTSQCRLLAYINCGYGYRNELSNYFKRTPRTIYMWIRTLRGRYNMVIALWDGRYVIRDWGDLSEFQDQILHKGIRYNGQAQLF